MKYCEDCKWFGIEQEPFFFGIFNRNEEVCLHSIAAYDGDGIKNNFRSIYTRRDKRVKHWPASLMRSGVTPGDRCGDEAKYFEPKEVGK